MWVLAPGIALLALGQIGVWWCPNLLVLMLAGAAYGLGTGVAQPTLNSLAVPAAGRERRGHAALAPRRSHQARPSLSNNRS